MRPRIVHKSLFNIMDCCSKTPVCILANEQNHIQDAVFDINFAKKLKHNESNRDSVILRENTKLTTLLASYLNSPDDKQTIIRKIRRISCQKIDHYSKAVIISGYILKVGINEDNVRYCLDLMENKDMFREWYKLPQNLVV